MNGWAPPTHPEVQPVLDHLAELYPAGHRFEQNWVTPTRCYVWVYDGDLRVDARTVDFTEAEAA